MVCANFQGESAATTYLGVSCSALALLLHHQVTGDCLPWTGNWQWRIKPLSMHMQTHSGGDSAANAVHIPQLPCVKGTSLLQNLYFFFLFFFFFFNPTSKRAKAYFRNQQFCFKMLGLWFDLYLALLVMGSRTAHDHGTCPTFACVAGIICLTADTKAAHSSHLRNTYQRGCH